MADVPKVGDFTVQRRGLHAHGQQNGIHERQTPVAGEISAGVHDKSLGVLLHVGDDVYKFSADDVGIQDACHVRKPP